MATKSPMEALKKKTKSRLEYEIKKSDSKKNMQHLAIDYKKTGHALYPTFILHPFGWKYDAVANIINALAALDETKYKADPI